MKGERERWVEGVRERVRKSQSAGEEGLEVAAGGSG